MSRRMLRLLVLDENSAMKAMRVLFGGDVFHAQGPLDASAIVLQKRIDVVFIRGNSRWQVAFAQSLSSDRRPALMVTSDDAMNATWADEWLLPDASAQEWLSRLQLAVFRSRSRRRTFQRASQDFLTGLPNRRSFVRGLLREDARTRRSEASLSLILIDLDDFKSVNEKGGHLAGDRLLRQVGHALRQTTRESEVIGRIGGDEFALAMVGDETLARRAAQRLQEALAQLHVSASIAVCEKMPQEDLRQLYRRCDGLLMALKASRRAIPPAFRASTEAAPWPQ